MPSRPLPYGHVNAGQTAEVDTGFVVMLQGLMDKVETLQAQIVDLNAQLHDAKTQEASTRTAPFTTSGKQDVEKQRPPSVNPKDVEKPFKFKGQRWQVWSEDLNHFLSRIDPRWGQPGPHGCLGWLGGVAAWAAAAQRARGRRRPLTQQRRGNRTLSAKLEQTDQRPNQN